MNNNLLLILGHYPTGFALIRRLPLQLQLLQQLVVEVFHGVVAVEVGLPAEALASAEKAGEDGQLLARPGDHGRLQHWTVGMWHCNNMFTISFYHWQLGAILSIPFEIFYFRLIEANEILKNFICMQIVMKCDPPTVESGTHRPVHTDS